MSQNDKKNILYTVILLSFSFMVALFDEKLYQKGLKGDFFTFYHTSSTDLMSAYSAQFYAMTLLEKEKRHEKIYFKDLFPGHWDKICAQETALFLYLKDRLRYQISLKDFTASDKLSQELNKMGRECFFPDDMITKENHPGFGRSRNVF